MYRLNKYRTYFKSVTIIFIISMVFLSATIWNNLLKPEKTVHNGWLFVWLGLTVISGIVILVITFRLFSEKELKSYIEEVKESERKKMLYDSEVKMGNNVEKKETKEINVTEIMEDLLPDAKGIKTPESFAESILKKIASKFQMVQGLCYQESKGSFKAIAKFAFTGENTYESFKLGETLCGQAALNQEIMLISDIPESYFKIESGLGKSYPKHLLFVPVIYKKKTIALFEMAYFVSLDEQTLSVFSELTRFLGERFFKFMK
jgi:putative methionine-R-sulfoxide reductase with GAF domain